MPQTKIIALITPLFLLSPVVDAGQQVASLLAYQVYEEGSESYFSRVLVTPGHMRMDEGEGSDGYTLYDRAANVVYNVLHQDRSILVIESDAELPPMPAELKLEEKAAEDAQAPTIADRKPHNVRFYANGELCQEVVAVPGLMQEAVEAMKGFRLLLARVQGVSLAAMPADTQTACDLAQYIYASERLYAFGLPVQESGRGRGQTLVDFTDKHIVDDKLFQLPEGYERISLQALGGAE